MVIKAGVIGTLVLLVVVAALTSAQRSPVYDMVVEEGYSLVAAPPSQIHLSLWDDTKNLSVVESEGNPDAMVRLGMTVSWMTKTKTRSSSVRFGQTTETMTQTARSAEPCSQYTFCEYASPWLHHVTIPGDELLPGTQYYYQCGDDIAGWSETGTFRTPVPVGSEAPLTFGVIGDLGQTEFSEQTLRHLSKLESMDVILHAGDLSYADSEQYRWDRWGRLVEPLASRMPWMVAAGNHEIEHTCFPEEDPFVAYQKRFLMPFDSSSDLQRRNLYYGFRVGMVHVVVLTPYIDSTPTSVQYQWLHEELARVDRTVTPWLVVIMHGPWYNSNVAHQNHEPHMIMKTHMEDLLFQYQVDLVVAGHVHAYERSYPVYKEEIRDDGIVYVVLGDAGNREGLSPSYINPKPEWSAFRQADYGYGVLSVLNRTHATLQWYEDRAEGEAERRDHVVLTTSQFREQSDDSEEVHTA